MGIFTLGELVLLSVCSLCTLYSPLVMSPVNILLLAPACDGAFVSHLAKITAVLPLPQHPDEEHYKFATPSTLKPTQIKCSEGSINQIPAWVEMKGDVRLTPFYNIHDCMKKFEGYVQELNDGESCDESSASVTFLATRSSKFSFLLYHVP